MSNNPTPTLPLSGEGAESELFEKAEPGTKQTPPPGKGEAGRGLQTNTQRPAARGKSLNATTPNRQTEGCVMNNNPTPTRPLSGEGAESERFEHVVPKPNSTEDSPQHSNPEFGKKQTPPPNKGEVGRGLNKPRLHNLKPQLNKRRYNRKNPTEPEMRFWSWVRGKQLGYKFRRQQGIGPYIVDFYCAERALVIELDGDSHYTPDAVAYDKEKTGFLEAKGFKVLRFTNLDVMQNKAGVLLSVMSYMENNSGGDNV